MSSRGGLVIVKIGGSVITYKQMERPRIKDNINDEELERIAEDLAANHKKAKSDLILIHGAGSVAHHYVKRHKINEGINEKGQLTKFANTQRRMNILNSIVTGSLIRKGLPAIPCQASAHAIMENRILVEMYVRALKGFLDVGLIPVLYGVPAYDTKQGCSILSGDDIASHLAVNLGASRIIFITQVDGVYTDIPHKPGAQRIPLINNENFNDVIGFLLKGKSTDGSDVTGGMLRKVFRAGEAASHGVSSIIIKSGEYKMLEATLESKGMGTIIQDVSGQALNHAAKEIAKHIGRNL